MVEVFCARCGATGSVGKVSASLICRCGSAELGLLGVDPRPSIHTATTHQAAGTGWGRPAPDPSAGWNDYQGPPPGPNPFGPATVRRWPCPNCQGSGYDLIDKAPCKACKGTGHRQPSTGAPQPTPFDAHPGPPAGGARWQGAHASRTITSTSAPASDLPSPPRGRAPADQNPRGGVSTRPAPPRAAEASSRGAHEPLHLSASCPGCRSPQTKLAADLAGHAWWCCAKCGSLADLDATPGLDPFDPPPGFRRKTGMRTKGRLRLTTRRPGRLFALLAAVAEHNEVSEQEALGLARNTLQRYPG
jgi:hypothetical protein